MTPEQAERVQAFVRDARARGRYQFGHYKVTWDEYHELLNLLESLVVLQPERQANG
jgi:hypothetical protein